MAQSQNINELATELAKAQAVMQPAVKDSENPFFKSHYADLSSVWDAIRKPLTDNGLSVVQTPDTLDGKMVLVTTLLHSSGQWISGALPVSPTKTDPQSMGSAITYARRYALSALAGVCSEEDDDGNAASAKPKGVADKAKALPVGHDAAPFPGISAAQAKRLYVIAKTEGKMSEENVKTVLQSLGYHSSKEIPVALYDTFCQWASGQISGRDLAKRVMPQPPEWEIDVQDGEI